MKRHSDVTRSGHSLVVMLTRLPVPGRAKTRLLSAIGPNGAAKLHRALTEHVALEVFALGAAGEARIEVWHDGGNACRMREWLGTLPYYRLQPQGDLGARLCAVMEEAVRNGAGRCVVVGSDCPAMSADHVRRALAMLECVDIVLGPAVDGGYWLIGLRAAAIRKALPSLFEAVSWGTSKVLNETLERASTNGLDLALLEELMDIDRFEDLAEWQRCRDGPARAMRVSVVIPTLNEQNHVGDAIRSAYAGGVTEVVVADGGSRDATREIAEGAGATVVEAPRGRARQMNAGAARASGEALLFLHADTILPPHAADLVRRTFEDRRSIAGAFSYRATSNGLLGVILTAGGRLRQLLSGHPYGDQGLFLRRRTFCALGGFPDLPVMEDWELVARLRRLGRVVVLPESAVTSAESFADHGLLWSSLVNVAVIIGYQLGLDVTKLAKWRRCIARRAG